MTPTDTGRVMPAAVCGFAEASHRGSSDLEQHAITELLNRLPSSPFMRRSIFRKLDVR